MQERPRLHIAALRSQPACLCDGNEAEAMHDSAGAIRDRITQLEQAAQTARLEAMRTAAHLLTKKTAELSGLSAPAARPDAADIALLQARYQGLQSKIEDLQAKIDWLHAQEHEHKHG
jgi:hypothetical protein